VSLDDQLAQLWAAGATLAQIERATGLNRGVAVGRIHRARKAGDPRFTSRPCPPKAKPKARRVKPLDEVVENSKPLRPPPAPPGPRLLVDLGWRDCRWPTGAAADGRHLFCGLPQVPERPYCERHCGAVRSES
jgi:GcrA cell cycle regulator